MANPVQNKSKFRFSLLALVLFIAAFAGAWFYVKPLWDEVSVLNQARAQAHEQKDQLNDQLQELQLLQQDLNLTSEVSRETTLTAIPEKLEQDKLINDLSDIAEKNDMVLNGVNFGVPTAGVEGEITKVSINANLNGNESSLVNFLKGVETNSRKLLVNNITVQIGETDLGLSRVNFNVNMEAYYQGTI